MLLKLWCKGKNFYDKGQGINAEPLTPNAEFLTFGGYRYDYSHPEIPHYNLIEVNEIDSLPNGSGPKVFERLGNNVADDIKEVLLYHLNSRKLDNERV